LFERLCPETNIQARGELLGTSTATGTSAHSSETTTGPTRRLNALNGPPSPIHESPFSSQRNSPFPGQNSREDYALREHTFIRETENSLDQYLAQGQAVLTNLVEQRGMLKGARTKLLGAANTLGLSRETISWVESRT